MQKPLKNALFLGAGYTAQRLATRCDLTGCWFTNRTAAPTPPGVSNLVVTLTGAPIESLIAPSILESVETVIDSIPPSPTNSPGHLQQRLEVFRQRGVKRYIWLSSTGVYGVTDGSWVDETTTCTPCTTSGKLRLEMEHALAASTFENHSILRISGIYGPGRGVGESLKAGRYRLLQEDRWTNRIHVDDLAMVVATLACSAEPLPRCLNVSDDEPALAAEVVEWYCRHFNLSRPTPISVQSLASDERLQQNQRISNRALREYLKQPLRFPTFREGAGAEFVEDGGACR